MRTKIALLKLLLLILIQINCKNKNQDCYKNDIGTYHINLNNKNLKISFDFLKIYYNSRTINFDSFFKIKDINIKNIINTQGFFTDTNLLKKIYNCLFEIKYFQDTSISLNHTIYKIKDIKNKLFYKKYFNDEDKQNLIERLKSNEYLYKYLIDKTKFIQQNSNYFTIFHKYVFIGKTKISNYYNSFLLLEYFIDPTFENTFWYKIYLINFTNNNNIVSISNIYEGFYNTSNSTNEYFLKENNFFSKIKIPQRGCIVNPFVNDDSLYLPYKECDFKFDDCGHFILLKNYEKN